MYLSWLKNYNLLIFDEIDSTNAEAIRLAKANLSGDFVIWAENQTAGRGRYGRGWKSNVGNLHVSILLNLNAPLNRQPELSFLMALAVYHTIDFLAKEGQLNLDIKLKWPNDTLINEKKVAGILLESINIQGKNYLIIGVGININNLPANIDKPATSLINEGVKVKNIGQVLHLLMKNFENLYISWKNKGFAKIRESWLKKAYKLGEVITFDDGNTRISGVFEEIDDLGALKIRLASGEICTLSAGEILDLFHILQDIYPSPH